MSVLNWKVITHDIIIKNIWHNISTRNELSHDTSVSISLQIYFEMKQKYLFWRL